MEVWGVGLLKGYFVQYKFIIPETIKHSSYTYQKLFRALYGYTQNVTKSNGKTYHYRRKGVLSEIPYIRPGKNCVIIPPKSFTVLDAFFKTGRNPTHYWRVKGNWKAVFYLDEKNLDQAQAIDALKDQIKRTFREGQGDVPIPDLTTLVEKTKSGGEVSPEKLKLALNEAEKIVSNSWFKEVYSGDQTLKKFYENYRALRS